MIEFKNVTKSYNGKTNSVDNLNLTINDGEVFGFLGANGAGKTSTLKMLTGINELTSGTITINGYDIEKNPMQAKKSFGYVPDSPDMFLKLTGMEYINFMGDIYKVPKELRMSRLTELAAKFGLENSLQDKIQSYSHGMRQKIIIIGALIHEPDVWILDEPLTGLDPKAAFDLKEMMREHAAKGKIVLFSTHVLEVAEKVCDKIAIIKKGKLIATGTMNEIKSKYNSEDSLEKLFLELTQNEQ